MAAKYRLPDEPNPGALAKVVVEPIWPLLASMVGGPWIGWPWFLLNAFAVGSANKWRQILVVVTGLIGSAVLVTAIAMAINSRMIEKGLGLRIALLGVLCWKLAVSYVLQTMQAQSVALFSYYRGVVRNGLLVVIAAALAESTVLQKLDLPLLWVMVIR